MARVSLDEAYDDRSVISQIVRLKKKDAAMSARMDRADEAAKRFADKTDSEVERIDEKNAEQDETIEDLDELVHTYDERIQEAQDAAGAADSNAASALNVAESAERVAEDADSKADKAQSAADKAQETADSALEKVADAYITSEIEYDSQSVTLKLESESDVDSLAMPVASASQAGVVNSSDYEGWRQYGARLDALEAKGGTVYASIPEGATSDEITDIYKEAAGVDPEPGVYIADIERQVTYEYDGSGWIALEEYEASPFGQGVAGLIVGSESDGQVYAESDGTGSVVGWDSVKTAIADAQAAADTAKEMADDAYEKAAGAQESADEATDKADKAQETADAAKETADAAQRAVVFMRVEIPASAWSGTTATVECADVTEDTDVIAGAAPESYDDYVDAGVRLSDVGNGTLTYECDDAPAATVYGTVAIF